MVVAQLVERLLPIPEARGLNPVIGKNVFILNIFLLSTVYWKDENKEKEARDGPFLKKRLATGLKKEPFKKPFSYLLYLMFNDKKYLTCRRFNADQTNNFPSSISFNGTAPDVISFQSDQGSIWQNVQACKGKIDNLQVHNLQVWI